jgi:hypothetical protein
VLDEVTGILVRSERVFIHGNSIKLEIGEGEEKRLETLMLSGGVATGAEGRLGNLFICEYQADKQTMQFPPTKQIVSMLLLREPTLQALPEIRSYALRPVFDSHFRLCNPGWNANEGILVHGPRIEINPSWAPSKATVPALERLPTHLRTLLGDFCFASDADVVNTVGVMLTGLLMTHFVTEGHPVVVLDGNQPGVGKTLLARSISVVLDGIDPQITNHRSDDAELQKQVLATLQGSSQACVIIDNAKVTQGVVHSPFLEANTVAPQISLRILGTTNNYVRPNDCLWYLTMNGTQISSDLVSRSVAIRFKHEGDPGGRDYGGRNPIRYALTHRQAILSELATMVVYWNTQERPCSGHPHRMPHWSRVVGGVLEANGFPEFLQNQQEAAAEFNAELEQLAAIAEQCVKSGKCYFVRSQSSECDETNSILKSGEPANKWNKLFEDAGIQFPGASNSSRAVGKRIGNFLTQYLGREIPVAYQDQEVQAVLLKATGRGRQTSYCFRLSANAEADQPAEPVSPRATISNQPALRNTSGPSCREKTKAGIESFTSLANPRPAKLRPALAIAGGNNEAW